MINKNYQKPAMKRILNNSMFLLAALVLTGLLAACDDDEQGGTPMISYVRITSVASSDSLLASAGQGQMVAIMGRNLQNTTAIWFNDQQAALNPAFITGTSIITSVPSQIPEEITNKMTLTFADGSSLAHDFTVDISKPLVARMQSEYVNTGEVATFYGDYFYEPLVATFTGDVQGEIVSVEDDVLQVRVPDGAQPGPVTIASNFGVTETDFWFRDNRNIIASFDVPLVDGIWRGPDNIVASDADIAPVSGNFIRVNQNLGAWPFFELYGGPAEGDIGQEAANIPDEALINPDGYSLKFEVNTLASLTGANMRLHLGNADNSGLDAARQSLYYVWEANIDTEGQWETVTIPWATVYEATDKFASSTGGYSMFIYFHGPNALEHNFGLDNIRVVPNSID